MLKTAHKTRKTVGPKPVAPKGATKPNFKRHRLTKRPTQSAPLLQNRSSSFTTTASSSIFSRFEQPVKTQTLRSQIRNMSQQAPRIVNSFDQIGKSGEFKRTPTDYHEKILPGSKYEPEANRYVLYVSLACPWAHRTLITRALKGLEDIIDVVVVNPVWGVVDEATKRKSWVFSHPDNKQPEGLLTSLLDDNATEIKNGTLDTETAEYLTNINLSTNNSVGGVSTQDKLFNKKNLREIYELNDPDYVGRYTVPVLFDTKTKTIVNTESAEIIQILDSSFQQWAKNPNWTLTPASTTRAEIDAACDKMYSTLNNGVYRAGFARTQPAYLQAKNDVYSYLDYLDDLLSKQRFICGKDFSEADIRALVTLLRFDSVYICHFKLAAKRIADYKFISDFMADVWQNVLTTETARATFNEAHIKYHYYCSHEAINPFLIVPVTTPTDFARPVDYRKELGKESKL